MTPRGAVPQATVSSSYLAFKSQIEISERLCLDALSGIHDQQRALTRLQRAAHLVVKVDVAWCVNEVERVLLALVCVERGGRLRLDCNASLLLHLQLVQHLFLAGVGPDCARVL